MVYVGTMCIEPDIIRERYLSLSSSAVSAFSLNMKNFPKDRGMVERSI